VGLCGGLREVWFVVLGVCVWEEEELRMEALCVVFAVELGS
jgi:hypothetical protein